MENAVRIVCLHSDFTINRRVESLHKLTFIWYDTETQIKSDDLQIEASCFWG